MTRIVNTRFFASPLGGERTPVRTNQEPDIILPGGGDPDIDPGTGDGGDISDPPGSGGVGGDPVIPPPEPDPQPDPSGSGTITLGNAPNITRRYQGTTYTTRLDTYPQLGSTFSITYIADGDCTLLPKLGWEDMTVSYSTNGREMTLTRAIPAGDAADSWWVGVEAWIYGGDNVEAVTIDYDRVHVGKQPSEVTIANESTPAQDAFEGLTGQGHTLIIRNGRKTGNRDFLQVGFDSYLNGSVFNNSTSVGAHVNRSLFQNPNNGSEVTGTTADVSRYTTVMAQTPLGVIFDRNGRGAGLGFYGNIATFPNTGNDFNGGTEATGMRIKGFGVKNSTAVQNSSTPIRTRKATSCSIDACYFLEDLNRGDNGGWSGDGADTAHDNSENCSFVYGGGIGNSRLLNAQSRQSDNCVHSRFITTCGATQLVNEDITQTFTTYGARNGHYRNCIAIDGFLFHAGITNPSRNRILPNYAFNSTNGGSFPNEKMNHEACIMLNDVRAFAQTNQPGGLYGQFDRYVDCVGFHSRRSVHNTGFNMLQGGPHRIERCTFGRNEDFRNSNASIVGVSSQERLSIFGYVDGMLIISPQWDYPISNDSIFGRNSNRFSTLRNIGLIGSRFPMNSSISGATTGFYTYAENLTLTSGAKYWLRVDPDSTLFQLSLGARNPMTARGLYGITATDLRPGFDTIYDGTNGNPYVNWISRSPYLEQREFWREYDCTSRGTRYRGNVGWAAPGVHPIDYMLREGTTPSQPINTPYIEDIYVYLNANNDPVIAWRPICPAYRQTIVGYDIYVDNQPIARNVPRETTAFTVTNLAAGNRMFEIVVKDATYGDSGRSRRVNITVP